MTIRSNFATHFATGGRPRVLFLSDDPQAMRDQMAGRAAIDSGLVDAFATRDEAITDLLDRADTAKRTSIVVPTKRGTSPAASAEILLTQCTLHPPEAQTVRCSLSGGRAEHVEGRILADSDFTAHNTFDNPDRVKPAEFSGASIADDGSLEITLPAASVVALHL